MVRGKGLRCRPGRLRPGAIPRASLERAVADDCSAQDADARFGKSMHFADLDSGNSGLV
jgi:hypothetical protein